MSFESVSDERLEAELLEKARRKSKFDVERLVATLKPVAVEESIRTLPLSSAGEPNPPLESRR